MKTLLLAMAVMVIPPPTQTGRGVIDPDQWRDIRIEGFKTGTTIHASVIGGGAGDVDCYFTSATTGYGIDQDFRAIDACDLSTTVSDKKLWLVIANNGNARDTFAYKITEKK
jgi:hypothetical protein